MAPVSKASAGTTTLYDNWSGIGDSGITVNAGGESYSGYPIGPQAATITVGAAAPYNVLAWCIDFTHTISVPGTYNDYTLVPLTPVGLQSVAGWLNSPQPSGLLGPGGQTIINEINYLMDLGNTLLESASPTAANDIGSAIQLAIWSELYPATISYTGAPTVVVNDVTNFLADAAANSGRTWGGEALISSNGEQQLAYGTGPRAGAHYTCLADRRTDRTQRGAPPQAVRLISPRRRLDPDRRSRRVHASVTSLATCARPTGRGGARG